MNPAKIASLVIAALLLSASWAQDRAQLELPRSPLTIGIHQIDAQLAQTADQRAVGLMFRSEMAAHEGMLFVFEQSAQQCFWMKNTRLALTAAFVSDDGIIVNLEDMRPQTTDPHCSTKPVRFVLEMNQGWFAKRGIKPGVKISGKPFAAVHR